MSRKRKSSKDEKITQISISLPDNLVATVDKMAAAENRNRSNFITNEMRKLVENYMEVANG